MSYRRIKSESVVKNSTSKNCRQNNSGLSRCGKVLQVQAKWRHNWYEPKLESTETRVIIRGPFNKPLLVSSTPYALTEFSEKPCNRKTDQGNPHEEILNGKRAATLRTGIPDPWGEYLTFGALPATCKRIHPKELYLWSDNIQLSETVWKQFGIPLEQGIPDPWITWP
ncbi:hypothetical protein C0J52_15407 [Blattella germanica]|nr:hypothetical protein C0J52_15407 [Blattella germanica]